MKYPKISIVTPSFNQGMYLEETIQSILSQGYPNLEYIIIDGKSSDNSVEIIKKYETQLAFWLSEADASMYEAIQKGFDRSTGEIMAWLNSDDLYHARSLFTIAEILTSFPEVQWLQGCSTAYDEYGRTVFCQPPKRWSKYHYYLGQYHWIQQESCVWKRSLWEDTGCRLNTSLKLAGDLELWSRYFQHAPLHVADILIGGFRYRRKNQLSLESIDSYLEEADTCIQNLSLTSTERKRCKQIKRLEKLLAWLKYLNKPYFQRKWVDPLYNFPPVIRFDRKSHQFKMRKK